MQIELSLPLTRQDEGGSSLLRARFDPATGNVIVTITPRIYARFDGDDTVKVRING